MIYGLGLAAFISIYLGGLFTLKYKDPLHRILGFASGVLLGAVFFDLLPEALELAGPEGFIRVSAILVSGFLTYHVLQRLFFLHACPEEDHGDKPHHHIAQLGVGTFITHSFFDGIAIGLSFQVSQATGLLVAFAVIAHDFADGLNTVSLLMRHKVPQKRIKLWLLIDALAPLAGITVAHAIAVPPLALALLLALFAGFFLYIATADLLPETHHAHSQWQTVTATIIGAAFMFVVSQILL